MKSLLVFLAALVALATGVKACLNSLFVEGHPHSHVSPTSPDAAKKRRSFIAEYEPSIRTIIVMGKEYRISTAWAEYRTRLSYFMVWFPIYPKTKGIHVTIEWENLAVDDQYTLKNSPFGLRLENGLYTYQSKNRFTGMIDGPPVNVYTFRVIDRSSKEEIAKIQLHKK